MFILDKVYYLYFIYYNITIRLLKSYLWIITCWEDLIQQFVFLCLKFLFSNF